MDKTIGIYRACRDLASFGNRYDRVMLKLIKRIMKHEKWGTDKFWRMTMYMELGQRGQSTYVKFLRNAGAVPPKNVNEMSVEELYQELTTHLA